MHRLERAALAGVSVFAQVEGLRGTGPRATGQERGLLMIRSGSGDPELQTGVHERSRGTGPRATGPEGFSA